MIWLIGLNFVLLIGIFIHVALEIEKVPTKVSRVMQETMKEALLDQERRLNLMERDLALAKNLIEVSRVKIDKLEGKIG